MKKLLGIILILMLVGMLMIGCNKENEKTVDNVNLPATENVKEDSKSADTGKEQVADDSTNATGTDDKTDASVITPETAVEFVQETLLNVTPRAFSVDFTNDGEMYVVCAPGVGNGTLYQVSVDGALTEICKVEGEFIGPGMCIDSENYLYITTGHSLKKYSTDGVAETVSEGFENAIDVCMDTKNNLYVSDEIGETIYKITPSGEKEVFVSYEKTGKRWQLFGIEYNEKDDCLYSSVNQNIYKYPVTSAAAKEEGELVYTSTVPIRCIAISDEGNIYTNTDNSIIELKADTYESTQYKLTKSGLIGISFGKKDYGTETLYITTDSSIEKFQK